MSLQQRVLLAIGLIALAGIWSAGAAEAQATVAIGPLHTTPPQFTGGPINLRFTVGVTNTGTVTLPTVNAAILVYKNAIGVSNVLGLSSNGYATNLLGGQFTTITNFNAPSQAVSGSTLIIEVTVRTEGLGHQNISVTRDFRLWRWSDGIYRRSPPNSGSGVPRR